MPIWPSSLPAPERGGYTEQPASAVGRFVPDGGTASVRRKVSRAPRTMSLTWSLDAAQRAAFDAFVRGDAEDGALWFDWPHPRRDETVQARLIDSPITQSTGTTALWMVQAKLEIAPYTIATTFPNRTWPASLPAPGLKGRSVQRQNSILRSDIKGGLAQQRRRFSAASTAHEFSLRMSTAQTLILEAFFDNACGCGALPFSWENPDSGATVETIFAEPWRISAIPKSIKWNVSLKLEVLP
jgi:hypothetical protein